MVSEQGPEERRSLQLSANASASVRPRKGGRADVLEIERKKLVLLKKN